MATKKLTIASDPAGKAMPTNKKSVNKSVEKKDAITSNSQTKANLAATESKKTAPKKTPKNSKAVKQTIASVKSKSEKTPSVKPYLQKIIFQIAFQTQFGQELFITGDHPLLGNGDITKAVPLQYFNESFWYLVIELKPEDVTEHPITYQYILKNADGQMSFDWGNDKSIIPAKILAKELLVIDSWNYAGYFENTFYTEPFVKVLLNANHTPIKTVTPKKTTHTLKVKTPLLAKGQTLCVLGSSIDVSNWDISNPVLLSRPEGEDFYNISLDLSKASFPIAYKYGVYDVEAKQFIRFEDGNNRVLHDAGKPNRQTMINDGFAILPNNTWKGAGIAIPVFSLRSEKSFGVGEFTDMALLVDWAKQTGLKMIQLLPVNDTTATHTWMDSYPYAAISAFALHPMYLNLDQLSDASSRKRLQKLEPERLRLNALPTVDYDTVNKIKWNYVKAVYEVTGEEIFKTKEYANYFERNKHWLVPYAAFCYLRDQYGTVDFSKWPAYKKYNAEEISTLTDKKSDAFTDIGLHYFIQYHLHVQLQQATAYAHANGIIVKGDIAIGVYRNGADAWQNPELYHLDFQAGAPPDDFAVTGQNWGFPTYNWQRMRKDGFAWWKQRFEQMSDYFDAFRIDHILGFFRIWSIPMNAVEGIMGHFVPAIPIHINEFNGNGIWFDHARYTKPFINENVLWQVFGYDNELVKSLFLKHAGNGVYELKPEFATQRLAEHYFNTLEKDTHHSKIQQGLYNLISNVILFEEENTNGQQFHFRFGMENTTSFKNLEWNTQQQLRELYLDYFFRRQDDFWMKEAMQKLPALKRVTNMLVCGEDLGLVPACVPDVMKQLGLLSLEIQRMPKDPTKQFFHPNDAPYLSVVTPSTHDMSTIRGWWEEDRERIQQFYNNSLGQWGDAPVYCEAWINKAIVLQHLYSPAMWSIFQLQDLLGMDELLRRANPADERINIPANPKHYWQYRMHISLEELLAAKEYNEQLKGTIVAGGR